MNYDELLQKAHNAGMKAGTEIVPTPMQVGNFPLVLDGVCGFAWVTLKMNNPLGRYIAKHLPKNDQWADYEGWRRRTGETGLMLWVRHFNQSMTRKEAYARAYCNVIREFFPCSYNSRMD